MTYQPAIQFGTLHIDGKEFELMREASGHVYASYWKDENLRNNPDRTNSRLWNGYPVLHIRKQDGYALFSSEAEFHRTLASGNFTIS